MKPFKITVDNRPIILTVLRKTFAEVTLHDRTKAFVDYRLSQPIGPDSRPSDLSNEVLKNVFRLGQAKGLLSHDTCEPDRMNPGGKYRLGVRKCTMTICRKFEIGEDGNEWVAVRGGD